AVEGSAGRRARRAAERGDAHRRWAADSVQLACHRGSGAAGVVPAAGGVPDPQLLDRIGPDDESEPGGALLEEYHARRGRGAGGGGASPRGGVGVGGGK